MVTGWGQSKAELGATSYGTFLLTAALPSPLHPPPPAAGSCCCSFQSNSNLHLRSEFYFADQYHATQRWWRGGGIVRCCSFNNSQLGRSPPSVVLRFMWWAFQLKTPRVHLFEVSCTQQNWCYVPFQLVSEFPMDLWSRRAYHRTPAIDHRATAANAQIWSSLEENCLGSKADNVRFKLVLSREILSLWSSIQKKQIAKYCGSWFCNREFWQISPLHWKFKTFWQLEMMELIKGSAGKCLDRESNGEIIVERKSKTVLETRHQRFKRLPLWTTQDGGN